MKFFIPKIAKLRMDWNKRPLTEDDFFRLCKRYKVGVQEMPLRVSGFYYCLKGGHYIAVDSRLPPGEKLFVMFHEFAHYLMHVPDTRPTANFHGIGIRSRMETEADAFALCAIIPRTWIETRTIQQLIEEDGFDELRIRERLELFELRGI